MTTVAAFNPVSDLAGSQTDTDEVTLTWSAATPVYTFSNGDAEIGTMAGWTSTVGGMVSYAFTNSDFIPQGTRFFKGGQGNALSKSYQRISPLAEGLLASEIDGNALHIVLDWWGGRFIQVPGDQPQMHIHFRDGSGTLISTHSSGYKTPTTVHDAYVWDQYQEDVEMPVGTRFIDIEMDALRNSAGAQTSNDGAFDQLEYTLGSARATPYVPGYAIYQDGVLIATAAANATEYAISGLAADTYEFKVVPYDGSLFLATDSNLVDVEVSAAPGPSESNAIVSFNDEQFYRGYLGGNLHGTTVACFGPNVNKDRPCC